MAPRQSIRARAAKASKPSTTSTSTSAPIPISSAADDSAFSSIPTTKKDKQRIKHSLLLSKVKKSSASSGNKKRRRPNKQLVTTLESLADALPDDVGAAGGLAGNAGLGGEGEGVEVGQARVMRQKSLRSRPGAMKRKEKMEKVERERFGRNLARIQAGQVTQQDGAGGQEMAVEAGDGGGAVAAAGVAPTADRWAALRGFIQGTMEKKEEFRTG
ncbi:hypothetical protein K490DRAFT_54194 [Saccharata proteae CBS 121410]|uniref:Ribosome biogenesis protein SLX9 n=1 Tax=Saccharata proteae CBS 121410 TaxID=1314787 RepID=A0A9P4LY70_9PEZI|nr:hypothetical protein K490DRAFT_54194 [Saccharata proteae CBS 121410]